MYIYIYWNLWARFRIFLYQNRDTIYFFRFKVSIFGTWVPFESSSRFILWPAPSTVSRYNLVESCEIVILLARILMLIISLSIMGIRSDTNKTSLKKIHIEKFVRKIDAFEYLSKPKILHVIIYNSRRKFLSYDPWTPITQISQTIPTLCYSNMFYYRGGGMYVATWFSLNLTVDAIYITF